MGQRRAADHCVRQTVVQRPYTAGRLAVHTNAVSSGGPRETFARRQRTCGQGRFAGRHISLRAAVWEKTLWKRGRREVYSSAEGCRVDCELSVSRPRTRHAAEISRGKLRLCRCPDSRAPSGVPSTSYLRFRWAGDALGVCAALA
jgi:hypothetical protein